MKHYMLRSGKMDLRRNTTISSVVMCSGEDFDLCGLCEKIHDGQLHFCPRTVRTLSEVQPVRGGVRVAVREGVEPSPDNLILLAITDREANK